MVYVLGQGNRRQWPDIRLKNHEFKTIVTCDVDHAFEYSGNLRKFVRRFAGDLLKRKSAYEGIQKIYSDNCFFNYWRADQNFNGLNLL